MENKVYELKLTLYYCRMSDVIKGRYTNRLLSFYNAPSLKKEECGLTIVGNKSHIGDIIKGNIDIIVKRLPDKELANYIKRNAYVNEHRKNCLQITQFNTKNKENYFYMFNYKFLVDGIEKELL